MNPRRARTHPLPPCPDGGGGPIGGVPRLPPTKLLAPHIRGSVKPDSLISRKHTGPHSAKRLEENFGGIEPEALRDSVSAITEYN